ncbi:Trehalose/maltose import ATP-binding protein MalK [uncultured archaeon]|nr:Trehalose/maltose import ATP-binding protein MalK [uncultured archaeon]
MRFGEISFAYSNRPEIAILDKMTFDIDEGSFVSVIGPSGCGKTTIANIIAGYLTPDTGVVTVQGSLVNKPGRDRFIISQEDDLLEWMTLKDNIQFVTKRDPLRYLRLVRLEGHEDKYPSQLSGGMKKRAAIARALAADAEYLMIDEAFESLDYQIKEQLYEELLQVWKRTNKTIILITHDIDEAIFLSDKIIVLTKAPSKVKAIIKVPFKRPRLKKIEYSHEFMGLRRTIRQMLDA